jgi:hypothetical protein
MWRNRWSVCLLPIAYCLLFLSSCKQDFSDDAIPEGFFADIIINLNLPEYIALRNDGGTVSIDGGVRGIILHRKSATIYQAFERNCSYHPNDACATVEAHSSNLYMIDTCCGSSFDFDNGQPSGGPAWRPLRLYKTYLTGSDLTVSSQSSNGM